MANSRWQTVVTICSAPRSPLSIPPIVAASPSPPAQLPSHLLPLSHRPGIAAKQIGVLVINCSLFNPTPSLAAMVINRFKMRSNIIRWGTWESAQSGTAVTCRCGSFLLPSSLFTLTSPGAWGRWQQCFAAA